MALTSGVAAYTAYFYNQKANTELVVQQQSLADVQQFRSSGAAFDQAVGAMSDALVDGSGIRAAQRDMRSAITRQISDALVAQRLLGNEEALAYVTSLGNLRETVDGLETVDSGQKLWQDAINLMSVRRKLIAAAERRALQGKVANE